MPRNKLTVVGAGNVGATAAHIAAIRDIADIVLLDISDVSILADFFVIATAGSDRQLRTLAEEVRKTANAGGRRVRVEGDVQSGWALVGHGAVITHLCSSEKRQLYRLEDAWSQARVVVRVQ